MFAATIVSPIPNHILTSINMTAACQYSRLHVEIDPFFTPQDLWYDKPDLALECINRILADVDSMLKEQHISRSSRSPQDRSARCTLMTSVIWGKLESARMNKSLNIFHFQVDVTCPGSQSNEYKAVVDYVQSGEPTMQVVRYIYV